MPKKILIFKNHIVSINSKEQTIDVEIDNQGPALVLKDKKAEKFFNDKDKLKEFQKGVK